MDDEPMVALALSFLLEDLGFRSCTAASGPEAIAAARRAEKTVAVVDLNLGGGMDGIATAAELRQSFGIPCILASGAVTDDIEAHASAAGATLVLQKPFKAETLKAALDEAITVRGQ
ncbi:MAG: response regulator [Magnetospirillum sp.]|nr:response regulator [Magnetospirillum sp.]